MVADMAQKKGRGRRGWSKVLLLLLGFFCLMFLFLGWQLRQGITVQSFSLGSLQMETLSLRWQNGLHIGAKKVIVLPTGSSSTLSSVPRLLRILRLAEMVIQEVHVDRVELGDDFFAVHYQQGGRGAANLYFSTNDISFSGVVQQQEHGLHLVIESLQSQNYNTTMSGAVTLLLQEEEIEGQLQAQLAGCLPLELNFSADRHSISFAAKQIGPVTTITPFVDLLGLSPDISQWFVAKLQFHDFSLQHLKGKMEWQQPLSLLDSLDAKGKFSSAVYSFADELPTVTSPLTHVSFNKGVLLIRPEEARYLDHDCGSSVVSLDFTEPLAPLLEVKVNTNTSFDDDIVTLLSHYGVAVPLHQDEGCVAADLLLTLALADGQVTANGRFSVATGSFILFDQQVAVINGLFSLTNGLFAIENLTFSQGENLHGSLTGEISAGLLDLHFSIQQWQSSWDGPMARLEKGPVRITYSQDEKGGRLSVGEAALTIAERAIHLSPFTASFDPHLTRLRLDQLNLAVVKPNLTANLSGFVYFSPLRCQLDMILKRPQRGMEDTKRPATSIKVTYDKTLVLNLTKSDWRFAGRTVSLQDATLRSEGGNFKLSATAVEVQGVGQGDLQGSFSPTSGHGIIDLRALTLDGALNSFLSLPEQLDFTIQPSADGEVEHISIRNFPIRLHLGPGPLWQLFLDDLPACQPLLPPLAQFPITAGALSFFPDPTTGQLALQGQVSHGYEILIDEETPLLNWDIKARIADDGFMLDINNALHVKVGSSGVGVDVKDLGFNLPAILALANLSAPVSGQTKAPSTTTQFSLQGKNTFIYLGKHNRLLADTLKVDRDGEKISARLNHDGGSVIFTSQGKKFSLQGDDLHDVFIGALLNQSRFEGGSLSVLAGGDFDRFELAYEIIDSHIRDFTLVNNIMAFVDTIPALVTFSLPSYSTRGMDISRAEGGISIDNGMGKISSFSLKSSTLQLTALGGFNLHDRSINVDVNVISQARSNLAKIPLAGYVFEGDKKLPGITVAVTGDLDNPHISAKMFRGIRAHGFGILKRTLLLPVKVVDGLLNEDTEGE